jgi:hypothetical protein
LSAVRLLAEIRPAGFEGSFTQLKEFVRQVRPAPSPGPVIRFETPAGRQADVPGRSASSAGVPWLFFLSAIGVSGGKRAGRPEGHQNGISRAQTSGAAAAAKITISSE